MAEEYLLPQVASEVAQAINKALTSVQSVNGVKPDPETGNVDTTGGSGLSGTAKALLVTILRNAVYGSDQSAMITALEKALASNTGGGEVPDIPDEPDEPVNPEVTLAGISATYSGGDVAVGTALNNLTGVVVKAIYSDGSTETVTDYTLSGEIAEGDNIITVTYEGKTTTFSVTGVAESTGEFVYDVNKWELGYYLDATGNITATAGEGTSGVQGQLYRDIPVVAGQTMTFDSSATKEAGIIRIKNNTTGKLFGSTSGSLNNGTGYKVSATIPDGCENVTVSVYATGVTTWPLHEVHISIS